MFQARSEIVAVSGFHAGRRLVGSWMLDMEPTVKRNVVPAASRAESLELGAVGLTVQDTLILVVDFAVGVRRRHLGSSPGRVWPLTTSAERLQDCSSNFSRIAFRRVSVIHERFERQAFFPYILLSDSQFPSSDERQVQRPGTSSCSPPSCPDSGNAHIAAPTNADTSRI
jgi:hypothetical protein